MKNQKENEIYDNEEGVCVEVKQPIYKKAISFLKRNKKKIIIGGSVVALTVAGMLLRKKLKNNSDIVELIDDSEDVINELDQ